MPALDREPCDLLISAAYVVPVVPDGVCLPQHSLVVQGGLIRAILPSADAIARFVPRVAVERPTHLLIPGLVNAHGHSPMTLFRGFADDLPLESWLQGHIWPAEKRWVGPEFVRCGSELAALEMLASGTTCFSDMYFFPEITAEVAVRAGIRAVLGLLLLDFPSSWAATPQEYLSRGREVLRSWAGRPTLSFAWAPHSPYATSDTTLCLLQRALEEQDLRVHLHVNEAQTEPGASLREHGVLQVERLARFGLLSERLIAAHFVHSSHKEVELFARAGAHAVHCAQSNAKLASGLAPVGALRSAGINVALGTDGAASNNNLDMIEEMQTAALLAKLQTGDAAALPAHDVLRMATLGGARALGLDPVIGSLEVGKAADCVCVDLRRERTWPVFDPVSQLVYAASGEQVTDTWVAGEALYLGGRHQRLERDAVLDRAAEWTGRIAPGVTTP